MIAAASQFYDVQHAECTRTIAREIDKIHARIGELRQRSADLRRECMRLLITVRRLNGLLGEMRCGLPGCGVCSKGGAL